jgi:DNA-directed RNA polymerase sigma subunit (sigma70/sigma32)
MTSDTDAVLPALETLSASLRAIADDARALAKRTDALRRDRLKGRTYRELTAAEARPLIVELVRDLTDRLNEAGAAVRRAEAQALYDEGMTMEQIAELFGVTRQRISVLVNAAGTKSAPRGRTRR